MGIRNLGRGPQRIFYGMVFAVVALLSAAADAESSPNIVVILADDMGSGDVHAINERSRIPTPNLDRLAATGMTFTDAHSPSAVCTPTRYGLLTGRYCWRTRLKRGVLNGYGEPLVDRNRVTIASYLSGQGYATGIVGKWHLGLGFVKANGKIDFSRPVSHGPNDLGFGFSFVIPASLDFPPYVYLKNGRVTEQPTVAQPAVKFPGFLREGPRSPDFVMADCLDRLADEATGFIERQAKQTKPFFLYFPLTAPHKPVLPHKRYVGKTELGPYGDFVTQVDGIVGRVLDSLKGAGVEDNTLVFYTSDNGSFMYRRDEEDAEDHVDDSTIQAFRADRHEANHIYRGTKADIWEAGHRVPLLVRWPGHVKPGTRSTTTVCLTDIFATAADVIGKPAADGAAPDSFSFRDQLAGRKPAKPRPPVIHHSAAGMFAIRQGKWKLVLGNGSGGRQRPRGKPFARPFQLYDIEADPGERQDLRAGNDAVVRRLETAFRRIAGRDASGAGR